MQITDKLRGKWIDDNPFLFHLWYESRQNKSVWMKENRQLVDLVITNMNKPQLQTAGVK